MDVRHYFRGRVSKVSAAGSPEVVSWAPGQPDRVYHVTRVAAENETSVGTGDIRLAIGGHGYVHPLRQFSAPVNDVLYVETDEILLLEGDELEARFTGTTSADKLRMYYEGWWEDRQPGRPG